MATLLLLVGAGILLYPKLSNYVNNRHTSQAIQAFADQVNASNDEALLAQLQLARSYNRQLLADEPDYEALRSSYNQILSFANGMMGYIEIPAIGVRLPIYHGTDADVLSRGVGHLPQTAFPVGGMGNHTVLTGHTGLPSAELFTGLTQLEPGHAFYITIGTQSIAYEIDQIKIVSPADTSDLQPVPGKDYCTLVTCTPYGINSHRLLV